MNTPRWIQSTLSILVFSSTLFFSLPTQATIMDSTNSAISFNGGFGGSFGGGSNRFTFRSGFSNSRTRPLGTAFRPSSGGLSSFRPLTNNTFRFGTTPRFRLQRVTISNIFVSFDNNITSGLTGSFGLDRFSNDGASAFRLGTLDNFTFFRPLRDIDGIDPFVPFDPNNSITLGDFVLFDDLSLSGEFGFENITLMSGLGIDDIGNVVDTSGTLTYDIDFVVAVPEPTTLLLMSLGLLGFGFTRRKRH